MESRQEKISFITQSLIKIWGLCTTYLIHLEDELAKYPGDKELGEKKKTLISIMKDCGFSPESGNIKKEKLNEWMLRQLQGVSDEKKNRHFKALKQKLSDTNIRNVLSKKRSKEGKVFLGNVFDGLGTIFSTKSVGHTFLTEMDKTILEGEQTLKSNPSQLFQPPPIKPSIAEYDSLFKILIIGDNGVGKSALILKFAKNQFEDNYFRTCGVDFKIKTIDINGRYIKFQVWDVPVLHNQLNKSCSLGDTRGGHGAIIVYDVTNAESFLNVQKWLKMKDELMSEEMPVFLVGSKCDLVSERKVSTEDAKELADQLNIPFLEVSSKDGTNVEEIFSKVAVRIQEFIEEREMQRFEKK